MWRAFAVGFLLVASCTPKNQENKPMTPETVQTTTPTPTPPETFSEDQPKNLNAIFINGKKIKIENPREGEFALPNGFECSETPCAVPMGKGVYGFGKKVSDLPYQEHLDFCAVLENEKVVCKDLGPVFDYSFSGGVTHYSTGLALTDAAVATVEIKGESFEIPDQQLKTWKDISFSNEIKTQINPQLTKEESEFGDYFKTQKEFEKFFGYDSKTGFSKPFVFKVYSRSKKIDCVFASKVREVESLQFDQKNWVCR